MSSCVPSEITAASARSPRKQGGERAPSPAPFFINDGLQFDVARERNIAFAQCSEDGGLCGDSGFHIEATESMEAPVLNFAGPGIAGPGGDGFQEERYPCGRSAGDFCRGLSLLRTQKGSGGLCSRDRDDCICGQLAPGCRANRVRLKRCGLAGSFGELVARAFPFRGEER